MNYSSLRNSARQPLAGIVPLTAPFTLYVDPINLCNFRCVQCPVGDPDYHVNKSVIAATTMERLAREILELGKLKTLKLYLQGEPMLHPEIGQLVMIAHRCAERVEITSNCSMLSPAKATDLIAAELDYLQVSVYGTTEERHKEVTKSPIPLAKVWDNVRWLRTLRDSLGKKKPYIYAKFFHSTPEEEKVFLGLWNTVADECGFDEIHDWDGQISLAERLYGIDTREPASTLPCPYPFYTLTVKANGAVTVCCVDWSDAAEVGDIYKESLSEIWLGKRLRDFQIMHLERRRGENSACRNCRIPERSPISDSMDLLSSDAFKKLLTDRKL